VQPGVVLDTLRNQAEVHKLTFAPDPSTHNRCTIGGMIGNNSCGTHSLLGGKTVDNVEELRILLYDGTQMTVGPATTTKNWIAFFEEGGRRAEIYAALRAIGNRYADLIRARFPQIPRRVSGYNLDELLPERFNVARALVGTEGTCVTVLEAK
jgi:FAD/FMN-containing dehydrogenase